MSVFCGFFIIIALSFSGCVPALFFGGGLKMGASTAEERGLGGVISDTALKNTISYHLLKHSVDLFSKISVTVHQGQALLTGVVENPTLKTEALQVIKRVGGIKEIIDEITVAKVSLSQVAVDSWITTQLNSSLTVDPDIQSINYKVKTQNGIIYLTGIAQSKEELAKVTEKARTIAHVKKVISHVKMKGQPLIVPLAKENIEEEFSSPIIEGTAVTVTEAEDLSSSQSPLADLE